MLTSLQFIAKVVIYIYISFERSSTYTPCFLSSYENSLMELIPPPTTSRRKKLDCLYTPEERKVLEEFKVEYRSHVNRQLRAQTFRSKILPALYEYWKEIDNLPQSVEESENCVKVITLFVLKKNKNEYN